MTFRGVTIGILVAVAICSLGYFNDHIVGQDKLVPNLMPPVIYGVLILLLLALNPALKWIGSRLVLSAGELAVIAGAWWLGRRRIEDERVASSYYESMVRQASWWGAKMQPVDTPNEYADHLSGSIGHEDGDRLVHRITDAYVGERYGHKNPARYQPDFAWRDLRPILTRWGIGNLWKRLWRTP